MYSSRLEPNPTRKNSKERKREEDKRGLEGRKQHALLCLKCSLDVQFLVDFPIRSCFFFKREDLLFIYERDAEFYQDDMWADSRSLHLEPIDKRMSG